jgi:hypothetical protein
MTTPDGMPPDTLRELVREVLRDVLPALANGAVPPSGSPATSLAAPLAPPPVPASGVPSVPASGVPSVPASGVPSAPPSGVPAASRATPPATPPATPARSAGPIGTAPRDGAARQPVRIATDEELHAFVLRILALADNPKRRRDLVAGRLRFTLVPTEPAAALPGSATPAHVGRAPATVISSDHRIEKGAVTERIVQAAANAGARLVLGPRAVLTPLAGDRARSLGVPIEKER